MVWVHTYLLIYLNKLMQSLEYFSVLELCCFYCSFWLLFVSGCVVSCLSFLIDVTTCTEVEDICVCVRCVMEVYFTCKAKLNIHYSQIELTMGRVRPDNTQPR